MAGTFTSLHYHIVFSTKSRKPFISEAVRPQLYEYVGGTIRQQKGALYEIGGTADHVHLLLRGRPDGSVSNLVRDIKSGSSGWIHKTFPEMASFRWQDGFGAFSVSPSQSDKVKAYILNQEEHHCKHDFKVEFGALLKAHGVDFNPDLIWR